MLKLLREHFFLPFCSDRSTIQNIILRYCLEEELNVVMNEKSHIFSDTAVFQAKSVKSDWHGDYARRGLYNVFAMHARFNHEAFSSLLGPSATYVTILRDPADAFESIYSYYNFRKQGPFKDHTFEQFVKE